MPLYDAPLPDFRFLLREVFDHAGRVASLPGLGEADMALVEAVLEGANRFSREVLLPINLPGDAQRCRWSAEGVRTPDGYRDAYERFCAAGWPSIAGDPAFGGQGLPLSLALVVREIVASGSMAFGMYGGLSQGACRAIAAHGSEALRQTFLPHLIDGSWTGTMCLTEPESGSDLSRLRTKAVPDAQGGYRVSGSKIFISGGDHDLAANIVHLVLARLPDAPPGTKGISLFVVPKRLPETGAANHVVCTSIEHKMGIAGSATASLSFDGSTGWLLGEPHGGLRAMFTMMNSSRVGVAVQSVGVAELSLQNARHYALERRQGRAPRGASIATTTRAAKTASDAADPIVLHPDVRKTLATMKALVEGSRAMYVDAAISLDIRARHADPAVRAAADAALALMTPVLKAFISDSAVQVTRLGMSVFGGHGYIHDNGMEQLLRDAAIVPLYEGTNGIQALDLVQRKITADEGRAVAGFFASVAACIEASQAEPAVAAMGRELQWSLGHLRQATAAMQRLVAEDPLGAATGASDYLRMFGLVACGHAWLRMARRAAAAIDGQDGGESTLFYSGKLKTARFFMSHLLHETEHLRSNVCTDPAVVTDLLPEEL